MLMACAAPARHLVMINPAFGPRLSGSIWIV
jgi:hypothetical protein